ncbi:unnamed protein product [Blepharisma stoltei]|uniref:Serine aminopeptidase S33 domain-containing protein n=1 Tax=Blepharisma stoltei TaxID=1481888 RepID=A0AAU9I7L5_9CILI|nr:unnamed protein product [Blepharisma stoltei]
MANQEWWQKYQGLILSAGIFYESENWMPITQKSDRAYGDLVTYRFHVSEPKALVFIFHGSFSAASYHTYLASRLYQDGFAVFAIDQLGHGKSSGPRGLILDLEATYTSHIEYIEKVRALYPENPPIFLAGESLGGTIALSIALKIPNLIKGLILYAPGISNGPKLSSCNIKIMRFLTWCKPSITIPKMSSDLFSRNPAHGSWWDDNPDCYSGAIEMRSILTMVDALNKLSRQLYGLTTPFIYFQGGKDQSCDPGHARDFVSSCAVENKEFVFYEEMYHAIGNEPEFPEIVDKTLRWMNDRI